MWSVLTGSFYVEFGWEIMINNASLSWSICSHIYGWSMGLLTIYLVRMPSLTVHLVRLTTICNTDVAPAGIMNNLDLVINLYMMKLYNCHSIVTSSNFIDPKYTSVSRRIFTWKAQNNAAIGLLPDTQNRGYACAGNAGNVFPVSTGKRSRHASRHVRHARAVMHAGIAN